MTGDWRALAACAALGLLLTALFVVLAAQGEAHGLPDRARLKELQGRLSHIAKNKYDVAFRLEPWKATFQYLTKERALTTVAAALREGETATVLVDGSAFADSEGERATIFALTVNGKVVRSFAEVDASWRADNRVFPWLIAVFGAATVALAATALYEYRRRCRRHRTREHTKSSSSSPIVPGMTFTPFDRQSLSYSIEYEE